MLGHVTHSGIELDTAGQYPSVIATVCGTSIHRYVPKTQLFKSKLTW